MFLPGLNESEKESLTLKDFWKKDFNILHSIRNIGTHGEECICVNFLVVQITCWSLTGDQISYCEEELDIYQVILNVHIIHQSWRVAQGIVHQRKAHFG